jgi:hypothetical protein
MYAMAAYSATEARRLFFRLLDAVQGGEDVTLERDGVRFKLVLAGPTLPAPDSPFAAVDAAVLAGEWTWVVNEVGDVEFRAGGADGGSGS